jgi:hypothetical protein
VTTTPDDAVVARSAVMLDELLTDPAAAAAFAEWAAGHAPPGLLDQLQAAADDADALMAAESRTLGGSGLVHARTPTCPRGSGSTCCPLTRRGPPAPVPPACTARRYPARSRCTAPRGSPGSSSARPACTCSPYGPAPPRTYEMLTFLGPDVVEGYTALREKRAPRFPSAQS